MLASPNMEENPNFWASRTIEIWFIVTKVRSWLFDGNIFTGLVSNVGSSFLLDPALNTCIEPQWSRESQRPCSQRLRLDGLSSSDLGLGTWDAWELALRPRHPRSDCLHTISAMFDHFIWVRPTFHILTNINSTLWQKVCPYDSMVQIPLQSSSLCT
jgi:hypothetical protein